MAPVLNQHLLQIQSENLKNKIGLIWTGSYVLFPHTNINFDFQSAPLLFQDISVFDVRILLTIMFINVNSIRVNH